MKSGFQNKPFRIITPIRKEETIVKRPKKPPTKIITVRIVCMNCRETIGTETWTVGPTHRAYTNSDPITHGICDSCFALHSAKLRT